jgi:hypothetical protein
MPQPGHRPNGLSAPALWPGLVVAALALGVQTSVRAQGVGNMQQRADLKAADEAAIAYKLTASHYHTTNQPSAYDINLRANLSTHTAWVGFYRQADEFRQLRVGYEDTLALPFGRITPSIQYATRGFLGGSVNLEVGERWFGLLGIGRTNRKDYFNLNFDPNDAVMIGAGTRALADTTLSVYQVRDDRLGTGQRITHALARLKPDARTRLTVDVFYKEGRVAEDGERVRGAGVSVTYDFDRYFVRLARDPRVNFTHENMVRASVGLHF